MKFSLTGIIAFSIIAAMALPTRAEAPKHDSKQVSKSPVKVFILAGQSNMEGAAVVDLTGKDYNDGRGTLVTLMSDPVKGATFKHLKDASGKWIVRDDVWVRYQRENLPLLAGPLGLGFSVYGDEHHFGPELQFGHVIGDYYQKHAPVKKSGPAGQDGVGWQELGCGFPAAQLGRSGRTLLHDDDPTDP